MGTWQVPVPGDLALRCHHFQYLESHRENRNMTKIVSRDEVLQRYMERKKIVPFREQ